MNKSLTALISFPVLFSIVISQLLFCSIASCENSPASDTSIENVLFSIGTVDQSMSDFTGTGYGNIEKYECTVGVDCSTDTFPPQMYKQSTPIKHRTVGASSVKILFNLSQPYENLFLRLARGGSETTIVTLDDEKIFKVTKTMLGSDERRKFGSYDLSLGSLGQGTHNIHLTVLEEYNGNGIFWWDALILISPNEN
jgi:hypothetical protein